MYSILMEVFFSGKSVTLLQINVITTHTFITFTIPSSSRQESSYMPGGAYLRDEN